MLPVSWDTVRLFLHVLAATIWVGGQITLAALVPVLRRLGAEIPRVPVSTRAISRSVGYPAPAHPVADPAYPGPVAVSVGDLGL